MSDPDLAGDYADAGCLRLTAGGAKGAAELAGSSYEFGVLCGDDGRPLQLLTTDGRAPLVTIDTK